MKILFIHQNFPGQYRHLVKYFAEQPKCEVAVIGESKNLLGWAGIKGVRIHSYSFYTPNNNPHIYLKDLDGHVARGQAVARVAMEIKKSGFTPDVVCVHMGWGEGLYIRDIFPFAKILSYCEFYYNSDNSDVNFEKNKKITTDKRLATRTRNATQLLSFASSDWGISPTQWQKDQYPNLIKDKISVIHDGIDTLSICPNPNASCTLPASGVRLTTKDEVITFVNRNLEPYRGFHIFAKALPLIQKIRPNAHILIVGADGVSYGAPPPAGTTFRQLFMRPILSQLDMTKIHFVGRLARDTFTEILQLSRAHIYLTYPFVLSWSLLEAMSVGCVIVGSKTQPVEEVISHGHNGLLVDFFSPEEIAESIDIALGDRERMSRIKSEARNTILSKYDLHKVCLPQQISLVRSL